MQLILPFVAVFISGLLVVSCRSEAAIDFFNEGDAILYFCIQVTYFNFVIFTIVEGIISCEVGEMDLVCRGECLQVYEDGEVVNSCIRLTQAANGMVTLAFSN